jgi:uncharacterized protein YtpQ (UPF0354 family)
MTAMRVNEWRFVFIDADDGFDGARLLGQAAAAIETNLVINMQNLFVVG